MMTHSKEQLNSLRCIITGGATIIPALVSQILNSLGKIIFNLFGTSKAGVCMITSPEDLSTYSSTIGKPLKGLSAKLMLNNHQYIQ
jgi:fatty-acyl-CoA synthase